jgi:hypothetical protein
MRFLAKTKSQAPNCKQISNSNDQNTHRVCTVARQEPLSDGDFAIWHSRPLRQMVFTSEIDISLVIKANWTSPRNTLARPAAKLLSHSIQAEVLWSWPFSPSILLKNSST